MTKITQIEDKGATIAWSPNKDCPDLIALGTKVGSILSTYDPGAVGSLLAARFGVQLDGCFSHSLLPVGLISWPPSFPWFLSNAIF